MVWVSHQRSVLHHTFHSWFLRWSVNTDENTTTVPSSETTLSTRDAYCYGPVRYRYCTGTVRYVLSYAACVWIAPHVANVGWGNLTSMGTQVRVPYVRTCTVRTYYRYEVDSFPVCSWSPCDLSSEQTHTAALASISRCIWKTTPRSMFSSFTFH